MPRPEDSPWAVPIAQVAARPGQTQQIDSTFPAPDGIGDAIVGIAVGADVHVAGSIDSIVDGLILSALVNAPVHAECTRCLTTIKRDWSASLMAFFPYDSDSSQTHAGSAGNGKEIEIIAGEEESEDVYPLGGAFIDLEAPLRDTLVEELPLQPLCRPDCRGLCPQCGLNLNEHPDHRHDVTDIRFDALKTLKEHLEHDAQQ